QAKINAQAPMPDVIRAPSGMLVQSPYIGMMNRAAVLMLRIAEQLGFTPVARPRLVAEGSEGGDDDARRWMQVLQSSNVRERIEELPVVAPGLLPGERLPATDDHVDIARVDLHGERAPAFLPAGDDGRVRADERIVDRLAPAAVVGIRV